MYIGNYKRLCYLDIDKPIPLNILIRADLVLVITLCGALALDYVNATGDNWVCMYTSINIVSRTVSF